MKKNKLILAILIVFFSFVLCSCFDNSSNKYNDEFQSITGKWYLKDEDLTYFAFDGSKDVMSFSYFDNGVLKYSGKFSAIYRGNGNNVITPLTLLIKRSDKEKEDWLGCYIDDFETDFTQFTIMTEEEDLGFIDGSVYTHLYRISELPYKMGTYILEGNLYKEDKNDYKYKNSYYIENGKYELESGESFTFLITKAGVYELFQYKKGEIIVEGSFWISEDKKTIYLYIEHDPFTKVRKTDREFYDTTFDLNYPPDFYLKGDFSNKDYIIINSLYHHSESPTDIKDSDWTFGTYNKN